ncbi:MAG: DUF192 domain-containing protein [Alphaproteobacteria bacterium]|jgi:uncharacterized membrane protein (UPF0127 family)|nr:DUF192 domain-containing protein [Alphaproteobacteria bacterium]
MKKFLGQAVCLWGLVASACVGSSFDHPLQVQGETFHVALASTPKSLKKGLMGVTYLPKDHGMLFIFPKTREVTFWMKDTPLDLDLVYLDRRGKILQLEALKANSLRHVPSKMPVRAALELPAGTVKRLHLKVGAEVSCEALRVTF